jgi:YfiH family protein
MTSPLISETIQIKKNPGSGNFRFHAFSDHDVTFGTFDCFDQNKNPLDFREKSFYLPLRNKFPQLNFASLIQTHSAKIHLIDKPATEIFHNYGTGDGLITGIKELGLTIRTADCLPLFLWNDKITALLHIGYKGLLQGILDSFHRILEMLSDDCKINAAIGDHIHECCFEVQEDILNHFHNFHLFRKHDIITPDGRTFINLRNMIKRWYEEKGFQGALHDLSKCSCCNENLHSYRRNKTVQRMGHVIFRRSIK